MKKTSRYQILKIEPSKDGGWNIRIQNLVKPSRADTVFIANENMNLFGLITGEFYLLALTRTSPKKRAITYAQLLPLASFLLLRWIRHTQFLENGTNISKCILAFVRSSTISTDGLFKSIYSGAFISSLGIPYKTYCILIRAWSERTNAVSICSFLIARHTPASLWKPISRLYGRRAVQVLTSNTTAMTPFLDREGLSRFLSSTTVTYTHGERAAINLIYAMSDSLKSGISLVHKDFLTDEQLSGLDYCLEHSIMVQEKNHVQLNSPNLVEASIRYNLTLFKSPSVHKFSHDEIVEAIDRASTFCRMALSPEERQALIYSANERISCIHSDRNNGDSGLENLAFITHELLFGEPSIIVNCCVQASRSELMHQPAARLHISQFVNNQFVPPTQQHQFIITNSNHLSIDDLYRILNKITPLSKILFIGRINHLQVSAWGSPYSQLLSYYSAPPLKNYPGAIEFSFPQMAALAKIILSSNTSLADVCRRCIHNDTFPMIATSRASIQKANHLVQDALAVDQQPILVISDAIFYVNDRLLSRRSVTECGIVKYTFAQLISCTNDYVIIKASFQYRKISLSDFLRADFTLGYCISLEALGEGQVEQAIVYLDTANPVTSLWVNTLLWTSSKPPVINYPSSQPNEITYTNLAAMQNITPGFHE